jgi:hypothetical protein
MEGESLLTTCRWLRAARRMKFAFLLPWPVIMTASYQSAAQPNAVVYELQERCAKNAAEFFHRVGLGNASYINHYNPELNGCFILISKNTQPVNEGITGRVWELWDISENRKLDEFIYTSGPHAPVAGTPASKCLSGDFDNCPGGEHFAQVVRHYMQQ